MPTPPYILELREVWGHRPLLLPGVSGVVVDGDPGGERVLLVRRTDTGRWSVPAGIVEPGEQPAACIARELWEETRVRARPERLSLLRADPEIMYPNGDRCQFISMTFRCRYLSGVPTVGDEESTHVAWFAVDALPDGLGERAQQRIASALPAEGPSLFDFDSDVEAGFTAPVRPA
jgi:8-oxo-dGTP diphosphatase